MFAFNIIFLIVRIEYRQWVHTNPQTQSWIIVPRPIVIQSRLFIEFLRIEKIRCIPNVVALLNENLTERNILNVLHHLAVKVDDVTTATKWSGW